MTVRLLAPAFVMNGNTAFKSSMLSTGLALGQSAYKIRKPLIKRVVAYPFNVTIFARPKGKHVNVFYFSSKAYALVSSDAQVIVLDSNFVVRPSNRLGLVESPETISAYLAYTKTVAETEGAPYPAQTGYEVNHGGIFRQHTLVELAVLRKCFRERLWSGIGLLSPSAVAFNHSTDFIAVAPESNMVTREGAIARAVSNAKHMSAQAYANRAGSWGMGVLTVNADSVGFTPGQTSLIDASEPRKDYSDRLVSSVLRVDEEIIYAFQNLRVFTTTPASWLYETSIKTLMPDSLDITVQTTNPPMQVLWNYTYKIVYTTGPTTQSPAQGSLFSVSEQAQYLVWGAEYSRTITDTYAPVLSLPGDNLGPGQVVPSAITLTTPDPDPIPRSPTDVKIPLEKNRVMWYGQNSGFSAFDSISLTSLVGAQNGELRPALGFDLEVILGITYQNWYRHWVNPIAYDEAIGTCQYTSWAKTKDYRYSALVVGSSAKHVLLYRSEAGFWSSFVTVWEAYEQKPNGPVVSRDNTTPFNTTAFAKMIPSIAASNIVFHLMVELTADDFSSLPGEEEACAYFRKTYGKTGYWLDPKSVEQTEWDEALGDWVIPS